MNPITFTTPPLVRCLLLLLLLLLFLLLLKHFWWCIDLQISLQGYIRPAKSRNFDCRQSIWNFKTQLYAWIYLPFINAQLENSSNILTWQAICFFENSFRLVNIPSVKQKVQSAKQMYHIFYLTLPPDIINKPSISRKMKKR